MEKAEAVSDPGIRQSLIMLAQGWRALALQIEETLATQVDKENASRSDGA
jgi:hypothetical protein